MRRLWLAVWFAVFGWDALLPHIDSPRPGLATGALIAAALLLIRRGSPAVPFAGGAALGLAVVAAGAAALLPWPERLGPLLVAVGLAIAALPFRFRWARGNLWRVPVGLGSLLTLLAGSSHVYRYVESSFRDLAIAAPPLAFLYRVLGVPAAADPPFVHLQGVGNLHTFDCTVEKLIGHGLAQFLVAGIAALAVIRGNRLGWRGPAALLLTAAGFVVVRTLALGLALGEITGLGIYHQRFWVFGLLLPLVAVLAAVLSPVPRGLEPSVPATVGWAAFRTRRAAGALAAGALAGILIAGAVGWFDPGREKAGRIIIDETHSNWEWSTVKLTTESYGVQTVYNYSELVRYLGHYYDIRANFEAITDSLLATTDVMILKTPTRPYEETEVDALVRFVEGGGGLWLVGDHTNVFGMSTNLNQVGRRFGLRYRFDAVIDLRTNGRQLFQRPRLFAHPSVRHLPPLLMATSSSMLGPATAERVMVGRSLLSDWLDYSVNSFFGNFHPDSSEPFGSMLQSVAVTRGKGRVLGFSDSTIFSNFFMFVRGKPELALGSVQWLMHENRFPRARPLLLALAAGALVGLVVLGAGLPRSAVLAALGVGVLGFAAAARGLDAWTAGWSRLAEPRTPLPVVAFDRGRTDYEVPDIADYPDNYPASFHTFYVWTQRVGYMPATRLFRDCLDGSEIVVFVNPRAHFAPEEVSRIHDYVRSGKGLLVLDSPYARHSSANEILRPFGLAFEHAAAESVAVHDADSGDSVAVMEHAGRVTGGEPVWLLPNGSAVVAQARVGNGNVVAVCASESFNDVALGKNSDVPTPMQLALSRIEYRIFDDLLRPGNEASRRSED